MRFLHVFSSIPVAERDTAVEWYERFTGRSPDLIPNAIEAAWQLTDSGWIYVIAEPDRAGTALITLLVDDLDVFAAELADRGGATGSVETMSNGPRFVMVTDPDGNRLKIAQTH
jgi:predicted enzyme related to lactoylglutathione lyase